MEIQTECRTDKAEEWAKKMDEIMIKASKVVLPTVGMSVDCQVSDHWTK